MDAGRDDVADLEELVGLPGGNRVEADQVMAYSPVDHGRLLEHRAVRDLAAEKGVTPAQLAIAWVLRLPDVFAVAKASTRAHVIENRAALEMGLSQAELDQLDRTFPPPSGKVPLDVL